MTPHDCHFWPGSLDGEPIVVTSYGISPRMTSKTQTYVCTLNGIPVFSPARFNGVDILDYESYVKKDVPLILPRFVCSYLEKTSDYTWPGGIFNPDCGPESAIRSADGKLIGVKRLEGPWDGMH